MEYKEKSKEPIKKFYDKKRNRFMKLRYESDTTPFPNITAEALASKLGYSKGTISALENPDIDNFTIQGKSARLFKAYHDEFNCSYEYLFGETDLPDPKHSSIDSSFFLNKVDSVSLNNLETLLSDKEFTNFNTYMLKAFLANPSALQNIMNILFRFLHEINTIYIDTALSNSDKELKASNLWFTLNGQLDIFLRDALLPNLQVGFATFEQEEAEREKKAGEEAIQKYEKIKQQIDTISVDASSVTANLIKAKEEDGQ